MIISIKYIILYIDQIVPFRIDCEELGLTGTFFHTKDNELPVGRKKGNWGKKLAEGAVFVRRGKLAAWSPNREDWEVKQSPSTRVLP